MNIELDISDVELDILDRVVGAGLAVDRAAALRLAIQYLPIKARFAVGDYVEHPQMYRYARVEAVHLLEGNRAQLGPAIRGLHWYECIEATGGKLTMFEDGRYRRIAAEELRRRLKPALSQYKAPWVAELIGGASD